MTSLELVIDELRAEGHEPLLDVVLRLAGHDIVGEFTVESWIMFAAACPAMLIGIYVGDRIQLGFSETTFRRVVCATLCLCGVTLLLK